MHSLIIIAAFIMDLFWGDPRWFPHPVRGIGWLIQRGESRLRRFASSPMTEKIAGGVLVACVVSFVFGLSHYLITTAFRLTPYFGFMVAAVMGYTAIAARDLAGAAKKVLALLNDGDIIRARKELSLIVGRDTHDLNEQEIVRAAVETVSENTSDGVIAPLFYMAIGGPALAMAYKAVNTCDSMLGYKNERYLHFGWAAARLDDVVNYIPARLTGVLLSVAALFVPGASWRRALHTSFRDGRNHPSPNSGYPEAAVAGALGVRLGGASTYGGMASTKPYIGKDDKVLAKKDIEKSILLMYSATLLAVAGAVLESALVNL